MSESGRYWLTIEATYEVEADDVDDAEQRFWLEYDTGYLPHDDTPTIIDKGRVVDSADSSGITEGG